MFLPFNWLSQYRTLKVFSGLHPETQRLDVPWPQPPNSPPRSGELIHGMWEIYSCNASRISLVNCSRFGQVLSTFRTTQQKQPRAFGCFKSCLFYNEIELPRLSGRARVWLHITNHHELWEQSITADMNKFNAAKPKISCGAHQKPKAWQNSWRAYPPSSSVHTAIWEPIDGAVWYYTCRSICSRVDLAVYNHSIIVLLCWEILNHYRHSRCGVDSNGANLGRATTRPSNASCFIVAGGQIGKKNIPAIVLLSY